MHRVQNILRVALLVKLHTVTDAAAAASYMSVVACLLLFLHATQCSAVCRVLMQKVAKEYMATLKSPQVSQVCALCCALLER